MPFLTRGRFEEGPTMATEALDGPRNGLTEGIPVQVNLDMGPLGKHWRTGYTFVKYAHDTSKQVPFQSTEPSCLVQHVGGPFDSTPVRYRVADVRPVQTRQTTNNRKNRS